MTRIPQWKSRKPLRRTSSTRHTEPTVSDSVTVRVLFASIKSRGLILPLFDRWNRIAGGSNGCVQEQYWFIFLCHRQLPWKWGKALYLIQDCVFTSNHENLISVIVFSPTADAYVSVELSLWFPEPNVEVGKTVSLCALWSLSANDSWILTVFFFLGKMWKREPCLKIWRVFSWPLMRLLMEGKS